MVLYDLSEPFISIIAYFNLVFPALFQLASVKCIFRFEVHQILAVMTAGTRDKLSMAREMKATHLLSCMSWKSSPLYESNLCVTFRA